MERMVSMSTINASYTSYSATFQHTSSVRISSTVKSDDKAAGISDTASAYLEKLKEKYGDYDFIIADYSTDEEAASLLSQGKGEYNVLITPETLEQMATDEKAAEKYEGIIAGADENFDALKDSLGKLADDIDTFGVTVDSSGKVNYYALMKESFAKLDSSGKKGAEKASNSDDKVFVKADTMDALIAKLKEVSKARTEKAEETERRDGFVEIPPESFESFKKKDGFPRGEEDIASIPPESFSKYAKKSDGFPKEDEISKLPPKSFEKYAEKLADKADEPSKLPPKSLEQYQKDEMDFTA